MDAALIHSAEARQGAVLSGSPLATPRPADEASEMPEKTFDVAVIGGGIVGTATAMAILRRHPSRSW